MSVELTKPSTGKPLTGRKVLFIFLAMFGLVLGVNLFMAWNAIRTFPGLEVSSGYADSQDFDVRRTAQDALGWHADVTVLDNVLTLTLLDDAGQPVYPATLMALLTRPTNQTEDQLLQLTRVNGAFTAPVAVSQGRWRLRLAGAATDGTDYRHNITFTQQD